MQIQNDNPSEGAPSGQSASQVIVKVAVTDPPLALAPMVTVVFGEVLEVVTANVADVFPAAILTVAGTVAFP